MKKIESRYNKIRGGEGWFWGVRREVDGKGFFARTTGTASRAQVKIGAWMMIRKLSLPIVLVMVFLGC
ncbi:MAG: hypothetical protein PHQ27_04980, partial [Victivallales bacterium]|nr:hypothetical protein [Victivallales bacterium]